MIDKEFPILEFDEERNALIRPLHILQPIDIAEHCMLCFFSEAIEKILTEYPHRITAYLTAESFNRQAQIREFVLRLALDACIKL